MQLKTFKADNNTDIHKYTMSQCDTVYYFSIKVSVKIFFSYSNPVLFEKVGQHIHINQNQS